MIQVSSFALPSGTFAALEAGPPSGPVALCLHGFPDIPRGFEPLLLALAKGGYRAVAPWLRGYAPSTLEGPYDLDRLSDDVLELVGALSPGRPVALIGHDWGAMLTYLALGKAPRRFSAAVTLAVPHPLAVQKNLLRSPSQLKKSWYMFFFQLPFLAEHGVSRQHFALIDRLWHDWSPGYSIAPAYQDELKECLSRSMPAPLEYYREMLRPAQIAGRKGRDMLRLMRRICVPTLNLHGQDDGCMGAKLTRNQEPYFAARFRSEVLPGVGHFLHLEAPDRVVGLVLDWLGA
jgi:pimeloyl-ACP methyl ester carboxylesterase